MLSLIKAEAEAPRSPELGGKPSYWIQRFELHLITSRISEKSEKIKCPTFLHVSGDGAIKVFNTFMFDDDVDDFRVLNCLPNTANHKKKKKNGHT